MRSTSPASRISIGIARAVGKREVERRRRHRGVERHAVVARRQRLVVGADLVADVAVGGDAIGADEHDVDAAASQQEAARAVDEHACAGRRAAASSHAVRLAPCSRGRVSQTQTCTGIPAACARNTGAVAVPQPQVASAPALQWVITLTGPGLRARRCRGQEREPVLADRAVERDVLGRRSRRPRARRRRRAHRAAAAATASRTRSSAQRRLTAVGRVASSAACARGERRVGRRRRRAPARGRRRRRRRSAARRGSTCRGSPAPPCRRRRSRIDTRACGSARWSSTSIQRAPRRSRQRPVRRRVAGRSAGRESSGGRAARSTSAPGRDC